MKRLLVNLDEDTYEGLRRLAFEKKVPMARLVRHAIEATFEDELDGIIGEMALEEHLRDPAGSMTIEEYMESRGVAVRSRHVKKGRPSSRRAAG